MGLSFLCSVEPVSTKAIMGRDPFGIFKEGEVHTISYNNRYDLQTITLWSVQHQPGAAGGRAIQSDTCLFDLN